MTADRFSGALPSAPEGAVPVAGPVAGAGPVPGPGGRSDLRPVVASGAVRLGLLPVSAAMSLLTSGLVIDAVGTSAYGAVLLVGTLSQLLPFADLGVGAAVTRAVAAAADPSRDPHVAAVVRRSRRVLLLSGGAIALAAAGVGFAGWWGSWLGFEGQLAHPDLTAVATLVLFALGLPFALGQRILLGAGKSHLSVAVTVVAPVTALALASALRLLGSSPDGYVLVYPAGALVASATGAFMARQVTGIRPGLRGPASARVLPVALPMFVVSLGLPIGLQSDKIVISHRLPAGALSEYALAFQLYVPAWSVLSTAAFALLPVFVRRRALGVPFRRLWVGASAAFAAVGVACAVVFVLAAPFVASVVSSGRIAVGLDLRLALGALLVVQTTSLVSGMLLNTPSELRFQAACVTAMMAANLGLSWVLAGRLGVDGPVVASVVTVGLLMMVPTWLRAARTAHAPPAAPHSQTESG